MLRELKKFGFVVSPRMWSKLELLMLMVIILDPAMKCMGIRHACIDACCTVEADTASWAQSELPKSAEEILEGVLCQFQDRYRRRSADCR